MAKYLECPDPLFGNRFYDSITAQSYIKEEERISGGILVYLINSEYRERIKICGFRKTSIVFGKRVKLIPEEEKELQKKLKSKLLKILPKQKGKKIIVGFWDEEYYKKRFWNEISEYFL